MTDSRKQRLFWTLIVVAATVGLAPGPAFSAWKIGKPIVTYFLGPALTDANTQQMAEGGWNLAWERTQTLAELDAAYAHGLRAMWTGSLDDSTVNSIRNHPALYSYMVYDEPSASQFADLASTVSRLRTLDPNRLAYINLFGIQSPSSQYGASDYPTYLSQYMNAVHPDLLSYDNYQFLANGDAPHYFQNLAIISHTAKQAGIPFVNIVQASSWAGMRTPNGNELRYLYNTSLAYGAQGISDYIYAYPAAAGFTGGGMASWVDGWAAGTPTTLYSTAQTINPQFVAIAQELQSRHHIGAYHVGDLPPGFNTTDGSSPMRLPGDSPFKLSPGIPDTNYVTNQPVRGAVLGLFGPDGQLADATHALAVNLNYSNSLSTTVTGPGNLSVFNSTTGTWTPTGHPWATLTLEPGGSVMVGLTSVVPEPSPLVLLVTGLIGLFACAWRRRKRNDFRFVT